jgi:hypothetical protein
MIIIYSQTGKYIGNWRQEYELSNPPNDAIPA